MSDMLGIASNAIGAYQRALSTVSNNIANVNTEGYSRQDVVLKDSAPKKLASMYIGTGVMLQNIKRQYDEFAESNLRNSNSDLSAQTPMVDYTKRVMDIMGDKNVGLSSALDAFFASANALSTDPASTVLRTSFLRSADGVGSRFVELSGQLDLISTETRQGMESVGNQINTLTSQLALINQSMSRSATLEGQPAELLDRRDLTLRQLSELVRIKLSFTTNGTVNVSLGTTMKEGLVVDGQKARPIGVNNSVAGKSEFVLDPYGQTESLSAISGGLMGGYQAFISQVLEPAQKNLGALAQVFVSETNAVQKNGIDGYGQMGQDIFAIDPAAKEAAAGVHVIVSDAMRVATAAQFRVSEGNTNVTTTRATVKYTGSTPTTALSNTSIVNNPNQAAGVTFKVDGAREYTPVTSLSAGVGATFYLDEAEQGQQLQILTRDGRQLLGESLTETQKFQLMTPTNGFAANANFSNQYLNQLGGKAYRGIDMFYGAKAEILSTQNYDKNGVAGKPTPTPANLVGKRIDRSDFAIAAGALDLNGVPLSAFTPDSTTNATIKGIDVGSPPSGFKFQAVIAGQVVSAVASDTDAADLVSLSAKLNSELQQYGLTVSLINNEQDLYISDDQGRDIAGVRLTPDAANAKGGEVTVTSAASRVANWLNGDSVVTVDSPNFSAFQATIGGVSFMVANLTANNPADLAAQLQTALRASDHSNEISVVVDGTNLKITDAVGREFKNVVLTPATPNTYPGGPTVFNSTVCQSGVRAEEFSEIRVPESQVDLGKPLILNGQTITGFTTLDGLVAAINSSPAGLSATLTQSGELVISNPQGSPIQVNPTVNGNALNVQSSTYGGQIRLVQVVRDMRVAASGLDFKQPLQINGVNLGQVAYDVPETSPSTTYSVTFGFPAVSVSADTPEALLNALNEDATFSASYQATRVDSRLLITPLDATITDESMASSIMVRAGNIPLNTQTKINNINDVVSRINSKQAQTGVVASLDINGDLQLATTDLKGTRAISIGPGKDSLGLYAPNMLGIEPLDYDVTKRLQAKLADENFNVDPNKTDIRISFGSYMEGNPPVEKFGDPADLTNVGFRTGAYIEGGCPDDLLLFVTGKGSANVSAGFSGEPTNMRDSLRSQSLMVKFTAQDRYSIIDTKTGTELADRQFDPSALEPEIEFQGLILKLSHAASVGDSFKIDGNFDGLGNNVNMLDMVDLSKKTVIGGKTLHDGYIDQVNNVGNLSQQAITTQEALTVVNDQAVASRDKVSGVNLDDEAAALVRYQQAYQAAAKALQVSGELFDSIVQIR